MDIETLIVSLYEIEAVKFGHFTLKSGISSPVYFDLRVIVAAPKILFAVADQLQKLAKERGICFVNNVDNNNGVSSNINNGGDGGGDGIPQSPSSSSSSSSSSVSQLCGVPYTALPIATCMSTSLDVPMIIRRKEAKDYGTKKLLEGKWRLGDRCLVVEDVVTSGSSVGETATVLRDAGLRVEQAVVILDRQQGGAEKLKAEGVELYSLFTISDVLKTLSTRKLIDADVVEKVKAFVAENQFKASSVVDVALPLPTLPPPIEVTRMKYSDRMINDDNDWTYNLFEIMERKKSNLCVAADVTSGKELVRLAEKLGPYICCLKTHVDIMEDFGKWGHKHLLLVVLPPLFHPQSANGRSMTHAHSLTHT